MYEVVLLSEEVWSKVPLRLRWGLAETKVQEWEWEQKLFAREQRSLSSL